MNTAIKRQMIREGGEKENDSGARERERETITRK